MNENSDHKQDDLLPADYELTYLNKFEFLVIVVSALPMNFKNISLFCIHTVKPPLTTTL